MADMELVIRIPKETYDYIKKQVAEGIDNPLKVYIANGTPLPIGHRRLIEDRISLSGIHFETERDHAMMIGRLNSALTIIEADKESEDA